MKKILRIGRDKSNDIVINEPRISRTHAIITYLGNDTFEIKDLSSSNGTFVNGERIVQKKIFPEDQVKVATCLVNWYNAFSNQHDTRNISYIDEKPFAKIRKTISIGSARENDLILSESFISNHHSEISLLKNGDYFIRDLSSSNGTYVNGTRILAKNFTKTDVVKIATSDLPPDWFNYKKLQSNVFRDHKKIWIILLLLTVIATIATIAYFNRCNWFNCGCILTSEQIVSENKKCLVHIVHDYYYIINFNGKKYYIGKNKLFKITEANTSKENLFPYYTVSGSGCFIKNDGSIFTSAYITNPWLNEHENNLMLKEVLASKTIPNFTLNSDFKISGETESLKWLSNGLINNEQNYIAATSTVSLLADSISMIINSVKKELPSNSSTIDFSESYKDNNSTAYYYSFELQVKHNLPLKDTIFQAEDSLNINKINTQSLNLPKLPEGSILIDNKGNLVGNVQNNKPIFIHKSLNK